MKSFIDAVIKQNKTFEIECLNCKRKNKLNTKDVYTSKKDYAFACQKCGAENTIKNIPATIKSLDKQVKVAGIHK